MKVEIQKNLQCFNEIQAGSTSKRKTWGAETPHAPRFSRNASDYDLHDNGRWVAAPDHYCSQHPSIVKA